VESGVAHRFAAAFNGGDVDGLLSCFTEEANYRDLFYGLAVGHRQIRALFSRMYAEGERHRWTMTTVADSPGCSIAEWTFSFTVGHGLPGAGRRLSFGGASVFETRDGLCHVYREHFDRGAALLALGMAPSTAARIVERRPTVEVTLPSTHEAAPGPA